MVCVYVFFCLHKSPQVQQDVNYVGFDRDAV